MKVLGIGNALVDIMIRIDNDQLLEKLELPKGSMQLVDAERSKKVLNATSQFEIIQASGGSAANTVHGCAGLGMETAFIGSISEDDFGSFFSYDLVKHNIYPILFKSDIETGRAVALISPDSERTFATYLGAASELQPCELQPEQFKDYNIFHIEGYLVQDHNLLKRALQLAKGAGMKVSLDMASYNVVEANLEFLKEMLDKYVDIVFANEEEAKAYTGKEPHEALDILAEQCEIAVVKIGKKGSLIKEQGARSKEQGVEVGVIDVNSIDSTGAGDLYASGFLYGLSQGYPLKKCGEIGSILSGKVIELIGPKLDEKSWAEARKMIEELS